MNKEELINTIIEKYETHTKEKVVEGYEEMLNTITKEHLKEMLTNINNFLETGE